MNLLKSNKAEKSSGSDRVHVKQIRKETGLIFFAIFAGRGVEICRTVFEDNPGKVGYNVHKHNP